MVCLDRPYHCKFFKGCLPQILLGPFLNIFSHMHQCSLTVVQASIKIFHFFQPENPIKDKFSEYRFEVKNK